MKSFNLVLPNGNTYKLPAIRKKDLTPKQAKQLIPDLPGIYFYLDDCEEIQYVGSGVRSVSRACNRHDFLLAFGYWEETIAFLLFNKNSIRTQKRPGNEKLKIKPTEAQIVSHTISIVEEWLIDHFKPQLNSLKPCDTRRRRWEKEGMVLDFSQELMTEFLG